MVDRSDQRSPGRQVIDVLVVGAGPAGLALALQAHDHGAQLRIVERRLGMFRPSRALIVHPRTLEALRPLGVTEALLARAIRSPVVSVHMGSSEVEIALDALEFSGSPFRHPVLLRQSDLEAVLTEALVARGVPVEYGVELTDLAVQGGAVRALLNRDGLLTVAYSRYLAGADGANSTVRSRLGIDWPDRSYRQEVVLADLELAGRAPADRADVVLRREGLLFLFPLGEMATWRLLATRELTDPSLPVSTFGTGLERRELDLLLSGTDFAGAIARVGWSSRIRLPHRIASRFRTGRAFLVGDAAHAHSPAGGQGMNTGIQDGLNLGWKLAFAAAADARQRSVEPLLTSYELERRPTARRVLQLTGLLFWGEAGVGRVPAFLRTRLAPAVTPAVPWLLRHRRLGEAAVWLLGQFWVRYRRSPLAAGRSSRCIGGLRPGDRLPDQPVSTPDQQVRLHQLTAAPGFHVLLSRDAPWPDGLDVLPVSVHRITSWRGTGVQVIRPDGYVGLRSSADDPTILASWFRMITGHPHPGSQLRRPSTRRSVRKPPA